MQETECVLWIVLRQGSGSSAWKKPQNTAAYVMFDPDRKTDSGNASRGNTGGFAKHLQ